jgi:hypothetical protein
MTLTRRLSTLAFTLALLSALAMPVAAQMRAAGKDDGKPKGLLEEDPRLKKVDEGEAKSDNHNDVLSDKRWWSEEHGISLRPPLNSRIIELDADDALVRIVGDGGYTIRLYVKQSKSAASAVAARDMTLASLHKASVIQKVLLKSEEKDKPQVDGRPAALLYYRTMPAKNGAARMVAQTYFNINDRTIAMLQFDVPDLQYRDTARIYQGLVSELRVEDPEKLVLKREEELARGDAWLKTLTGNQLEAAIVPEQYFVMLDQTVPTGYVVIYQKKVIDDRAPGISVRLVALMDSPEQDMVIKSHAYISMDRQEEYWSTEVSIRSRTKTRSNINSPTNNLPDKTWRDSGERAVVDGKMMVRIKRDTPAGEQIVDGEVPPKAYLSQAETYMLDKLLPHDVDTTYGFIAYSGTSGRMTMRTDEVTRTPEGALVTSITVPNQPAQVSHFDRMGKLLGRSLANGHVIRPTTMEELKKLWPDRFTTPQAD